MRLFDAMARIKTMAIIGLLYPPDGELTSDPVSSVQLPLEGAVLS